MKEKCYFMFEITRARKKNNALLHLLIHPDRKVFDELHFSNFLNLIMYEENCF